MYKLLFLYMYTYMGIYKYNLFVEFVALLTALRNSAVTENHMNRKKLKLAQCLKNNSPYLTWWKWWQVQSIQIEYEKSKECRNQYTLIDFTYLRQRREALDVSLKEVLVKFPSLEDKEHVCELYYDV